MGAAQTSKMTEEKATQTGNLLNALVDHTTQAVIATEMLIANPGQVLSLRVRSTVGYG